jgi:hypothetical protein
VCACFYEKNPRLPKTMSGEVRIALRPSSGDEVYSERDIAAITAEFAVLESEHAEMQRQLQSMSAIAIDITAAQRAAAWIDANMRNAAGAGTLCDAAVAAQSSQRQLLIELTAHSRLLTARATADRLRVYAQVSKVPPPTLPATMPLQRCDERCALGRSLGGTSALARQRCCGAYVCAACLHRHNFEHSNQARGFYAPCFNCSASRAIFRRIDRPPQAGKSPP